MSFRKSLEVESDEQNSDHAENGQPRISELRLDSSSSSIPTLVASSSSIRGETLSSPQSRSDLAEGAHDSEKAVTAPYTEQASSASRSSFRKLVQGWETTIGSLRTDPHMGRTDPTSQDFEPLRLLENLSLCGPLGEQPAHQPLLPRSLGPSHHIRDAPQETDPTKPVSFTHAHSSPLQYTPMIDKNERDQKLADMRRSNSTPSAFKDFRNLQTDHTKGIRLDGRAGSAFSQPQQRPRYVRSHMDTHYSAFEPVQPGIKHSKIAGPTGQQEGQRKSIPQLDDDNDLEHGTKNLAKYPQKKGSSKPAHIFSIKGLRRRRRSGRENPVRPPSTSSSSKGADDDSLKMGCESSTPENDIQTMPLDDGSPSNVPASNFNSMSTAEVAFSSNLRTQHLSRNFGLSPSTDSDGNFDEDTVGEIATIRQPHAGAYHSLGSNDEDETTHILPDSPATIPSPAYQEFASDEEHPLLLEERPGNSVGSRPLHPRPMARTPTHSTTQDVAVTPQPRLVLPNKNSSPASQDSASLSRTTTRSSQTNSTSMRTQTTSTATISSGQTVTSSLAEADREVMETNRRGRGRREGISDVDGTASAYSSSTSSTNLNGYVPLSSSPSPLRDGAALPVERFFATSVHSMTPSSGSKSNDRGVAASSAPSTSKCTVGGMRGRGSPMTVSSLFASNTNLSTSAGEEPPQIVSYLDKKTTSPIVRASTKPLSSLLPDRHADSTDEERESPAHIVGYSQLVWEEGSGLSETTSRYPRAIRPSKVKHQRSKPPRSPVKLETGRRNVASGPGLRTGDTRNVGNRTPPTTPPTNQATESSPGSGSTADLRSPPRQMIDSHGPEDLQRMGAARPQFIHSLSTSRNSKSLNEKMILVPPVSSAPANDHGMTVSLPAGLATFVAHGANNSAQEVFEASLMEQLPTRSVVSPDSSARLPPSPSLSIRRRVQNTSGKGKQSAVVTPDK